MVMSASGVATPGATFLGRRWPQPAREARRNVAAGPIEETSGRDDSDAYDPRRAGSDAPEILEFRPFMRRSGAAASFNMGTTKTMLGLQADFDDPVSR